MITTKSISRNKSSSANTKINTRFFIFPTFHLYKIKSDFMFLSETGLSIFIPMQQFTLSNYSPLTIEQELQNCHSHGFTISRTGFNVTEATKNKNSDFPLMCFQVAFVHSKTFIFTVYFPQEDGIEIDDNFSDHHSATIHMYSDFNIHYKEWLFHSNKTNEEKILSQLLHHLQIKPGSG